MARARPSSTSCCSRGHRSLVSTRGAGAQPRPTLKIGVTLHPYYSWTKNVVGDSAGLRGAVDSAGRDRRRRLPAAARGHQEARRSRRDRRQRHRPRRLHLADDQGVGQHEASSIIRPNETTPQIHVGARHRRQLAHVHLVHQRHSADLRDSEGARGAPAAGRGGAAAQRRRLRAAAAR